MNTRSKRASSVGVLLAFVLAPPLPDGSLNQADRQHIAWSYSGIAAGAAEALGDGGHRASWRVRPRAAWTVRPRAIWQVR